MSYLQKLQEPRRASSVMNIGSDNLTYDEPSTSSNFESGDIVMTFHPGNHGASTSKTGRPRSSSAEPRAPRNSAIARRRPTPWSTIKSTRSSSAEIMSILNNETNIMNNEKESDIFKDNAQSNKVSFDVFGGDTDNKLKQKAENDELKFIDLNRRRSTTIQKIYASKQKILHHQAT